MGTVILKVIPMLLVIGAVVYSTCWGIKLYRTRGHVSVLVLASLFAGLAAGRLLDRVDWLPQALDDWVNYRGGSAAEVSTRAEPYLGVLSAEIAILLVCASILCIWAVSVLRRDAEARTAAAKPFARFGPIGAFFAMGLILTARAKIAVAFAFVLAKAHII